MAAISKVAANAYLSGSVSNFTSVSTAFAVNVTAGSTLVAILACNANETQAFNDNNGNTWVVPAQTQNVWHTNLANGLSIAYVKNANAGATTVSNSSATNASRDLIILELAGADLVSPLDGTPVAVASDTTQDPDPGSIVTTLAGGIVIGAAIIYPTTGPTAATGYVREISDAPVNSLLSIAIEDQLTSAAGTYDPNWATSESHWLGLGIAFKPSASSGAAFAGTPADASSATGKLQGDFAGAATDASAATGSLYPFPSAQVSDASTAAASLTTQVEALAAASDASSATGALTNFASIVLTAPLYTGVGGILDPNFWAGSVPVAGTTVWYDPTNIVVETNGEIDSSSNNCTAVVQFQDGQGQWWTGLVVITPGLVAYPASATTANAALTTAIQLLGAAQTLISVSAGLNTQIKLGAAASSLTAAAAVLATQIQLAASAVVSSSASGTLQGTQGGISAAASDSSAAAAVLNTQIQMLAAATSVIIAAGSLSTQILIAGGPVSISGALASVQTGVPIAGQAVDTTSATGTLSGQILLAAAANDFSNAAAQLLTQVLLLGAASSSSVASASLRQGTLLTASATAVASVVASLSTIVELSSAAQDGSTAGGSLSTGVQLAGAASDASQVRADLATIASIEADSESDSSVAAALKTGIPIDGQASDSSSAGAGLFTSIDPDANPTDESQISAELGVAGSRSFHSDVTLWAPPEIDWPPDGLLPFGRVFQRVNQRLIYAVAWSQWLAQRWQKEMQVAVGDRVRLSHSPTFQLKCIGAGVTGETEPRCPASMGAELLDGTAQWQVEPLDDQSLAATIVPPVSWSADSFVIAFTNERQVGQTTLVTIDTSLAISGVDYDITVVVNTSDGREKSGKIRIKVR